MPVKKPCAFRRPNLTSLGKPPLPARIYFNLAPYQTTNFEKWWSQKVPTGKTEKINFFHAFFCCSFLTLPIHLGLRPPQFCVPRMPVFSFVCQWPKRHDQTFGNVGTRAGFACHGGAQKSPGPNIELPSPWRRQKSRLAHLEFGWMSPALHWRPLHFIHLMAQLQSLVGIPPSPEFAWPRFISFWWPKMVGDLMIGTKSCSGTLCKTRLHCL